LFRGGKRNGTPYARIMTMAARGLKDGDIAALAAYFSALEATPATSRR
jgi:cytochrome c553